MTISDIESKHTDFISGFMVGGVILGIGGFIIGCIITEFLL